MTFKTQLADDLDVFFNGDEFAETIVYNGAPIPAVVEIGENLSDAGPSVRAEGVIFVRAADVPAPAYRDTVTIADETWRVVRVVADHGLVWEAAVDRDVRPTFRA